jgi:predicted alpha/beta-hydrolase family hydrolase
MSARVDQIQTGLVRGFLHLPDEPSGSGFVLAHGAGSNASAPILVAAAQFLAAQGSAVLRIDLPFRQKRPHGPPLPVMAEEDRRGIDEAASLMRQYATGAVTIGGHSYGGRQASMLAADKPHVASRLLLFSYPLHPPAKPAQLRTAHFRRLATPALFVHGTKDGFGTIEEITTALTEIPAHTECLPIEGAGHDLRAGKIDWPTVCDRLAAL